jgi:hypothetical protein
MTFFINDFVNREEQLTTLWKIVRQETDERVLLIHGIDGMGKTYLLNEFQAECEAEGINCVEIDFGESPDQDCMAIVLSVYQQLGPQGFEHLVQTYEEASTLGASKTVTTPPLAARAEYPAANPIPPGRPNSGHDPPQTIHGDKVEGDKIVGRVGDVGPGAQVIIGKQIEVTQIMQRDDPWVQQMIQARITAAFRDCLVKLTTTRKVVFLLNCWHKATTETCQWLCHHLLDWILTKKLPDAAAVVCGLQVPDLRRSSQYIRRLTLAELPDEAVRTYWIEKRGLPPHEASEIIEKYGGFPLLLYMLAERRALTLGISG